MKKIIFEAAVIGSMFLGIAGSAHAGCGAVSNTSVGVFNSNVLFANQTQVSSNKSGGNKNLGNMGWSGIVAGPSKSTSNQNIVANQNNTVIGVSGAPVSSTLHLMNTGSFVAVCN